MEDFKPKMIIPKSIDEQIAIHNATHYESQIDYQKMTVEEVIKKFGDVLTEEQIQQLTKISQNGSNI